MNTDNKINRRDALKRMGATLLSGTIASYGLLSLTSCEAKKNKRIIFYFTGTGNSLYIARQLAGENTELLSIPQLVKHEKYEFEADEIGIVYPIYGHMPPNMVRQFIQKTKLNAKYKFAVLTYGARKCDAVEIWDRISRKAGYAFDYINTIIMVDNWLPGFDMNEQLQIDKHIPENLQKITADIDGQKHWHEPVTEEERQMHQGFLQRSGLDPEVGFVLKSEKHFTVTDKCVGCGICTHVCPRGNYAMTSTGVETSGDCECCFACIQNCPQKAIQFLRSADEPFPNGTEKNPNARYRNKHVSLLSIQRANNQVL